MKFIALLLAAGLVDAQDAATLSDRAQALASEKRLEEAERLWKDALAKAPDYFPALFNLGYFYYSRARFDAAEPLLDHASQVTPGDFNTWYLLGATRARMELREPALRAWRRALAIQPKNLKLIEIMSVEYSKGHYFLEAATLAERALSIAENDPNLYFLAIKAYQDAGDYGKALDIARRAVARFPESARANFEVGFHIYKLGQVEESLRYLKKAMETDPAYEEPFFFYGDVLVRQGQNEEAIPFLRKAIANRSDYVPARVVLARALMNLERWPEAITELQAAAQIDPKHPQPHFLLSQIYFRLGDEERARSEKDISLKLRRENPTVLEAVQARRFPEDR